MIITKKALPRRTFLKGVQAALALPLLDAMIPAATALAKTAAKPIRRLGYVFIPMGYDHARWTPTDKHTLGQLTPILSPLEPVKEQLTVVTNTALQLSYPGTHDTSNSGFFERSLRQAHRELGLFPVLPDPARVDILLRRRKLELGLVNEQQAESKEREVAIAVGATFQHLDLVVETFQRSGGDGVIVPGENGLDV